MGRPSDSQPILIVQAFLWDGSNQLGGDLALYKDAVRFHFKDFQKSQLQLVIPITSIKKVEEFLLYDLERTGLKITSNSTAEDLFISEQASHFKKELELILHF